MKYSILDEIHASHRALLLLLCGLTCCWGFVNNNMLLIFASKVGFPLGITACAMSRNRQSLLNILWYTVWLVSIGTLYFFINPVTIDPTITKNFVPTITDALLALGLGIAISFFWYQSIRINIIIMSTALASLLPACIMTGYWLSNINLPMALCSFELYLEYALGMCLGSVITDKISCVQV